MASFMRKLAPQLVTPDRQLSYFLPDILSFARIFFPPANSPLIVSPHLPRTYLPIPASCPRLGFRPTYLFKQPFGPQQTPYPASVRNPACNNKLASARKSARRVATIFTMMAALISVAVAAA